MDGDHRGAERSNRISRDEEIHLILRTLAHAMKVLKEQKEWRKEILQRLDTLDQNFRALLATPEKEARRILVEHDRVRSPIFIIQQVAKNKIARSLLKLMPFLYSCQEVKREMTSVAKTIDASAEEGVIEELADLLWVSLFSLFLLPTSPV